MTACAVDAAWGLKLDLDVLGSALWIRVIADADLLNVTSADADLIYVKN